MEKKFLVSAVTFLTALLIWIAFFVLFLMGRWTQGVWPAVILCLVVGGLVLFSSMRCRQLGGPTLGSVVRSVALLLMAFFTFWKIGIITAAVLLAAAIATGIQALMGSCQTKDGDN
jgi:hypothetical protein